MPYDLFSPTFKANPFPTFAHMRENCPVYAHQTPKGHTIWYITRYDDVLTVLHDTEYFVKDFRNVEPPATASLTPNIHQAINQNMLFADPPNHTRLRSLVNLAFTPRRIARMAPQIQMIANRLLDQGQARGKMDLIADYAQPLPMMVISNTLGIPAQDQVKVFEWSQAIISPGRRSLTFRARRRKVRAFLNYLRDIFQTRQRNPQDDLITALVQAEQAGDKLTELELSSMVALLLVTGHETTVHQIGNSVLTLLQQPAQFARFKNDSAIIDLAFEELLRYDGPVETSTTRWARQDVEFGRQLIQHGDIVRVVLISANRDATHFIQPDQLNLTRQNNRHLAFGHGIHYCLGAPLARLEGKIALETLFQHLPQLRLVVPISDLAWQSGVIFRGLTSLPVKWD